MREHLFKDGAGGGAGRPPRVRGLRWSLQGKQEGFPAKRRAQTEDREE